jgi:hypothetical protein
MNDLPSNDLREVATEAATLIRFGLSPRLRPSRESEYNALVIRFNSDATFRSVVHAIAVGQGLLIHACNRLEGLVLGTSEESPYRMRLSDYVQLPSTDVRLLHGVIQLGIAATAYPTAAALEDGGRLASVSGTQVYERVRAIIDEEHKAAADEPASDDPDEEPVWRAIRRLRAADTTTDGRDTPHNVIGAIRKALKWLEQNGLADEVKGEMDTWRLRDRYRLQVLGAAGEAVDLLRSNGGGEL